MTYSVLKRGFTMIELLVVIVIIGILAAAMVPAIGRFLTVGDDAVSRNNLMRLGRAVMTYRAENKNCYPAAGGYFSNFWCKNESGARERRYGRARGWVYFEHSCPRSKGDRDAADSIGDGNHNYDGCGMVRVDGGEAGTEVNEQGCCICFDSKNNEGGINPKPASWYGSPEGLWSQAQTAIVNGALFEYVDGDFKVFSNPSFNAMASQKLRIPKHQICRAYAMNVITGTDKDLYDTSRDRYGVGGGTAGGGGTGACVSCGASNDHAAIRLGRSDLMVYVDSDTQEEALPSKTALIVELDLDNENVKSANDLAGDQVWDWDKGDESMGFIHENNGMYYAHVCFADGHVDAIADPSSDPTSPNTTRRQKLSKWYGSGGLSSDGEKLD
jgi:prepilin-type N-terminal cleavage/methylation domain-containing protein/prepilin-type processing-associated H-X9-DG protein